MWRLSIANPKGGVGKSLVAILAIEWFLSQGKKVAARDADANQTLQTWLRLCASAGREIPLTSSASADVEIIDTAGLPDTIAPFLEASQMIVSPYKPLTPDVTRLARWYQELSDEVRARVYTLPNMLRVPNATLDESRGCSLVRELMGRYGKEEHALPGLSSRPAVFGAVYSGSDENFFDSGQSGNSSWNNGVDEARHVFERLEAIHG